MSMSPWARGVREFARIHSQPTDLVHHTRQAALVPLKGPYLLTRDDIPQDHLSIAGDAGDPIVLYADGIYRTVMGDELPTQLPCCPIPYTNARVLRTVDILLGTFH